ncbi:MAG: hypothetical protein HY872_04640 [Chloroflexi bacterium]|nr:hypothetical protein [Chloroflexota bacterium]MBI5291147.1 hypothetical protein [Chloroflexota bacterium]
MKTSPLISKIVTTVLSGLAVLGLSAAAFAWAPDAIAATPAPGEDYSHLEMAYGNAQVALKGQQNRIDLAKQIAANVQTFIDAQKANGKNTSSLDAALANYRAQFASAQTAHDQAASVLSTHAGFDANGTVTDSTQAKQTLRLARDHMRQARTLIASSGRALHAALRVFRQANRPVAAPQP